jgi:hypothetical protein
MQATHLPVVRAAAVIEKGLTVGGKSLKDDLAVTSQGLSLVYHQ